MYRGTAEVTHVARTHTALVNHKDCINIKFEFHLKYLKLKVNYIFITYFIFYVVSKILYSYK